MITKEYINELKCRGNNDISHLVNEQKDSSRIIFILKNLGHLPKNFETEFLLSLFSHHHPQVRLYAVKNYGKSNGKFDTSAIIKLYEAETDTSVKREIVSAIGRQRDRNHIEILCNFLSDNDPRIVCQAIRGLWVFENDTDIESRLRPLINHRNEMVRTVIYKKYYAKENQNATLLPHTQTYDYLKNTVVNADVLETMKYVPDESVHLTFTSPPYYNARDYSIYQSYQDYLEFLEKVFIETHRITKEGRFLIVNTSPIIIPRVSRAHSSKRYAIPFDLHPYLVKNGWEFIDDIVWLKPEASVKNRIGGFMQHRKPLGYKPNSVTEYLLVYRKSTEKLLDWNIRNYDSQTVINSKVPDSYESTNVWCIDPCYDKIHSAIFPTELCKRVIQYYSYVGDLVFDPFGGSGTVGRTAKQHGRCFFMTEQDQNYFLYMQSKKGNSSPSESMTKFLTLEQFIQRVK
jgi:DNA modification methylase